MREIHSRVPYYPEDIKFIIIEHFSISSTPAIPVYVTNTLCLGYNGSTPILTISKLKH